MHDTRQTKYGENIATSNKECMTQDKLNMGRIQQLVKFQEERKDISLLLKDA